MVPHDDDVPRDDDVPYDVDPFASGSSSAIGPARAQESGRGGLETWAGVPISAWPDGWIVLDGAGRVVGCNERFFELWGFSQDEVAALRAADPRARRSLLMSCALPRARDPETFAAGMRRQLGLPEEVTFDDVALKDGRILERYGAPLRDDAGRSVGRAITLRDVTGRRRADVELRERARQQEALADLGRAVVAASDIETLLQDVVRLVARTLRSDVVHFLASSERGERLALRAGTVLGAAEPECVDPARSPAGLAMSQNRTVVITDLSNEDRFVPAAYAQGYKAGVSAVVRGRARPSGVLCAHWTSPRGVTEDEVHFLRTVADFLTGALARFEAEAEILERERGIRAVFDASLDGLLTFGEEGVVTDANPAAARIFERPLDEMLGREVLSLFGDAADDPCQGDLRALTTDGRCSGVLQLRLAGRPPRIVEYAAVAGVSPGRNLVVLRDVTEGREMQARLAIADRMASVGTVAAGVAHELNNPLSYVAANLSYVADALRELVPDSLRAGATLTQEIQHAVQEAREGAAKMRSIIQGLRTFSRGDEERTGPVDLEQVLESCVSMAWNEMKHRARLVRRIGDVPPVRGNEARLAQVFLNLLVNAAQAIADGAADRNTIEIAARHLADGRVSVEVTDTGSGIPPEIRGRIFDPFFTTKPIGVGTGLGLSICHSIVSSLGGSIEVESEPGKGTTFRVLLHAAEEAAAPLPTRAEEPLPGRRGRILVVDDDPLVAAAIRRALESEHDVAAASSAREALALVASGREFDLVVSDLLMPEMTGMDLHAKLAELAPDLAERMIFMTGGAFTPAAHAFVQQHADACMEKPFDPRTVRDSVRRRLVERGGGTAPERRS